MLSNDELNDGIPFILKLWDTAGVPFQWVERLKGETARRWYNIYQQSNWAELRLQASGVFHNRVTEENAESIRKASRCVVISTQSVKAGELAA